MLVLLAMALIGELLGSATTTDFRLAGRYESERASALLEDRLRGPKPLAELVIVQSPSLTVDDDAFRAKVDAVHAAIVEIGPETIAGGIGGQPIFHYYQALAAQALIPPEQREQLFSLLVSPDQRTVLMHYTLAGDSQEAIENIEEVIHVVQGFDGTDDFRVLIGGDASVAFENNELSTEDLESGERFGIPIALIILLVLFGAVAATLLPLGMAIIAIFLALAAVSVIGQYFELLFFVQLMITMIGLAVGIDYSLLIVSRFREEMGRGLDKRAAVVRTGATAAALCSSAVHGGGGTPWDAHRSRVVLPIAGAWGHPCGACRVGRHSHTLAPRCWPFSAAGVDFLSIPFLSKYSLRSSEAEAHGFWVTVTHTVTRFPVVSILLVAVPMIALSYFYFGIETGLNDVNTFPDKSETKAAFIVFEEEFSMGAVSPAGILSPAEIVIDGDAASPQVQEGIARLVQSLQDDPIFPVPPQVEVNDAGDLGLLTLPFPGKPNSRAATENLTKLREVHVASAFEGVPAEVYVGGVTAEATDFFGIVDKFTPIIFAFVLGSSFIILMLVFRSIVIPIKAIIMNLLSVGATYGLLVLVFQNGVGTDLLGFQHAEVIDAWIRCSCSPSSLGCPWTTTCSCSAESGNATTRPGQHRGGGLRAAVDGGMITGAALIMVAVFGAFAAGRPSSTSRSGSGLR